MGLATNIVLQLRTTIFSIDIKMIRNRQKATVFRSYKYCWNLLKMTGLGTIFVARPIINNTLLLKLRILRFIVIFINFWAVLLPLFWFFSFSIRPMPSKCPLILFPLRPFDSAQTWVEKQREMIVHTTTLGFWWGRRINRIGERHDTLCSSINKTVHTSALPLSFLNIKNSGEIRIFQNFSKFYWEEAKKKIELHVEPRLCTAAWCYANKMITIIMYVHRGPVQKNTLRGGGILSQKPAPLWLPPELLMCQIVSVSLSVQVQTFFLFSFFLFPTAHSVYFIFPRFSSFSSIPFSFHQGQEDGSFVFCSRSRKGTNALEESLLTLYNLIFQLFLPLSSNFW